jgi:hypothetical protein
LSQIRIESGSTNQTWRDGREKESKAKKKRVSNSGGVVPEKLAFLVGVNRDHNFHARIFRLSFDLISRKINRAYVERYELVRCVSATWKRDYVVMSSYIRRYCAEKNGSRLLLYVKRLAPFRELERAAKPRKKHSNCVRIRIVIFVYTVIILENERLVN